MPRLDLVDLGVTQGWVYGDCLRHNQVAVPYVLSAITNAIIAKIRKYKEVLEAQHSNRRR